MLNDFTNKLATSDFIKLFIGDIFATINRKIKGDSSAMGRFTSRHTISSNQATCMSCTANNAAPHITTKRQKHYQVTIFYYSWKRISLIYNRVTLATITRGACGPSHQEGGKTEKQEGERVTVPTRSKNWQLIGKEQAFGKNCMSRIQQTSDSQCKTACEKRLQGSN